MDSSTPNRVEDRFVAFLTQSLPHLENYNIVVVIAMSIIMVSTVLTVIQRFKRHRHVDHFVLFEQHTKTLNSAFIDDQLDELSMKTIFDVTSSLKYQSTMSYEKLLSELHSAADKCYINKYSKRCIELVIDCPFLINVKFGSTGLTPFHRVCFHGHAFLIQFMLSRGANPHLTSDAGENVICMSVYYYLNKRDDTNRKDMICLDILQRAGCRLEGNSIWYDLLLKMAIQAGKTTLIEWLFANNKMPKSKHLERCDSHPPIF